MSSGIDRKLTDVGNGFVWREEGAVSYLACEPLERVGFKVAFSSRKGGVSLLPEDALNLSYREDKKEHVDENRRRFLSAIKADLHCLVTAQQTHSDKGILISSYDQTKVESDGDALVSKLSRILLGIQSADCLPVLIGDPEAGVMAAIHSGWRGAMTRITEKIITDTMQPLGAHPENCWVALGPSACGGCYEVGSDVVQAFKSQFPESVSFFQDLDESGKALLDVRAVNVQLLCAVGVPASQIFVSTYCTIHDNDLFFSYRQEGRGGAVMVGRQLSVIGKK